jgi:hypothetical protein
MAQFTTSAKTLTFYVETEAVIKLGKAFGHKLDRLTQDEKYQLCTAIALHLWGCCEGVASDDFDEDFGIDCTDIVSTQSELLGPEVSAHTMSALVILQNEPPEILAQLLPAIAEYARDDDR